MRDAPEVSVCVLTAGRAEAVQRCLASLANQSDPPRFEVLVAVNGDGPVPDTSALVDSVLLRLPDLPLGAARNRLVDRARGSILLFLDDDVVVDPGFLRRLADVARDHPDVGVFGGPNLTPSGSSAVQRWQGEALGSLFGSGAYRHRYRSSGRRTVRSDRYLTLCNMAVRRTVFSAFSSELPGAEENELLARMFDGGVVAVVDPGLTCGHERRSSLSAFASQAVRYGYGRGRWMRMEPRRGTDLPQLVCLGATAYVVVVPAAVSIWGVAGLVPVAAYGVLVAASALRRRPVDAVGVACTSMILHVGYVAGLVRGVLTPARRRAEDQPEPREATL